MWNRKDRRVNDRGDTRGFVVFFLAIINGLVLLFLFFALSMGWISYVVRVDTSYVSQMLALCILASVAIIIFRIIAVAREITPLQTYVSLVRQGKVSVLDQFFTMNEGTVFVAYVKKLEDTMKLSGMDYVSDEKRLEALGHTEIRIESKRMINQYILHTLMTLGVIFMFVGLGLALGSIEGLDTKGSNLKDILDAVERVPGGIRLALYPLITASVGWLWVLFNDLLQAYAIDKTILWLGEASYWYGVLHGSEGSKKGGTS